MKTRRRTNKKKKTQVPGNANEGEGNAQWHECAFCKWTLHTPCQCEQKKGGLDDQKREVTVDGQQMKYCNLWGGYYLNYFYPAMFGSLVCGEFDLSCGIALASWFHICVCTYIKWSRKEKHRSNKKSRTTYLGIPMATTDNMASRCVRRNGRNTLAHVSCMGECRIVLCNQSLHMGTSRRKGRRIRTTHVSISTLLNKDQTQGISAHLDHWICAAVHATTY